ncbi:MAG: non-canonical purine NTP pyrophosphatase [Candidatus Meridianibacter frigidus]|nr:MAG: non-canonical purine NTP pyrophosphatase [Candidatus Eremiobacteraeota bacterium]
MKTYVATKNADKLRELRAIFARSALELDANPKYRDVEEGDTNYADNAKLKARALSAQLREVGIGAAVLADDSGIEVDALDGRPGVLSARYAGDVSWPERRAQLLREVRGLPADRRGCKFVCAMAFIYPDGSFVEGYGEAEGRLTTQECGKNGFGYDPIFFYPPAGKTFAELSEHEKNHVSHRYHAAQSVLDKLANA